MKLRMPITSKVLFVTGIVTALSQLLLFGLSRASLISAAISLIGLVILGILIGVVHSSRRGS